MSTNSYLKFLTEEFVKYLNSPKENRKEKKMEEKDPLLNRWFGVLPFSLKLLIRRK